MTNPWTQLVIAGLLEVAWALGMKQSLGFTRPGWSAFTIATMIASFYLLSRAMQALPVGTAYAVWTGIGAVGAAILGVIFLGDSASPLRIGGIAMILTGIVAIKLAG